MIFEFITKVAKGNVGAATFCMEALQSGNKNFFAALSRMLDLDITGEKIYLIWNDCCDRDTDKAIRVMLEESKADILDHIDVFKNQGRGKPFD